MSLLLDALKKAAKDKQLASAESDAAPQHPHAQPSDESRDTQTGDVPACDSVSDEPELELSLDDDSIRTTTTTVSDEALQLLIFKTNREYRRRQKIIWSGVAMTSVAVLLLGGYYFYGSMVEDVESLERKHRIAIQKVNAEVIRQKRPELIADLISETPQQAQANAEQSASAARAAASDEPALSTVKSKRSAGKPAAESAGRSMQISRRQQQDPVAEWLQQGWDAYQRADYQAAQQAYQQVLAREARNRDALLGVAAIAMKQQHYDNARAVYAKVLQLDPRDPVAVAALTSLKAMQASDQGTADEHLHEMSESRLKTLLKQRPDAAPVQFALGNISARQKRWPQAQAYYFNAWMAEPDNADYAFNLAVSLDHMGKRAQARQFYQRSLTLAATQNHSFSRDAVKARLQTLDSE